MENNVAMPVEPTKENLAEVLPTDSTVNVVKMAENLLPAKGKPKSRAGITKKIARPAAEKKARKLAKKMRRLNPNKK